MRHFDETFWKMLLGFIVMLVIGLASIFVTGYLGTTKTASRDVGTPTNTASVEATELLTR